MGGQRGHEQKTGIHVQTRRDRNWIRRIALGLAVTAIMAPTADAIGASSTGSAVRYVPVCGPIFYGGAPDWVGVDGQYVPVCGPMFYGGAPDSFVANSLPPRVSVGDQGAAATNPLAVVSTEQGIDWRDAGAGAGIGAALGLLAAGAVMALKRRGRPVGVR
jgi:hypothetical protein